MQGHTHTEQQLLAALAAGDRHATERIYQQNYPIVNGWLIKNGCSSADAADLFQEAMVVLFGRVQDEHFHLTCSIGTYVFAISKHLWYKRLQRKSNDPLSFEEKFGLDDDSGMSYEEDVDIHYEREAHYEQLNNALDQVGEPCRSLLKAFYHHDKSMQEIAADFGYTNPDNAKTQKYKCLMRLRKLFYGVQAK